MKYVMILPDGCADEPIPAMGGRTALEAARVPNMDAIAQDGIVGFSNNTPQNLPAGSDVATMSVLGYDPQVYYTGRAPLEAAAMGIPIGERDWAIRCNFVTLEDGVMKSFSAGHISSEEGAELMQAIQSRLGTESVTFYPGVGYRNIVLWRDLPQAPAPLGKDLHAFQPHDYSDRSILHVHPYGPGSVEVCRLMSDAHAILADHPVNRKRIADGKCPATDIWLWGQGILPKLPRFAELYGKTGAMITAVDLLRGLANVIGWDNICVPTATGLIDTDYAGKARAAINALADHDIVCVHVEATDEAGHEGDIQTKIEGLRRIDQHIVGPLREALKAYGAYRILVTPDHPTPVRIKTHTHNNVPWTLCGTGITPDTAVEYNENVVAQSAVGFPQGCGLMPFFLIPNSESEIQN